jgi:poly-beta-1,6-N-acetyl-D-glucosamine synthase
VFECGGEDWYAQQCAKMKGWRAEAVPALKLFHARHTGAASGLLRHHFRVGKADYYFGSHPVFEFLKCTLRASEKPWLLSGVSRFLGFGWCYISSQQRHVSREFVEFLRREQRAKILGIFRGSSRERCSARRTVDGSVCGE